MNPIEIVGGVLLLIASILIILIVRCRAAGSPTWSCYLDRSSFGVLFGEKSEPYERGASGKAHKDSCDRLFCGDVGREYCDGVYPVKRSRKRTKSGAVSNGSAFSLSKNDKK